MTLNLKVFRRMLVASAVGALLLSPAGVLAQDHVVPRAEFRSELREAAAERQNNIERLERFLSSELTGGALAATNVDAAKIQQAIPQLSDAELARLAAQADRIESDFAAGLTERQVTYVIIGATVVTVLLIIAIA